jgi:photosystem II stability/assembly factor-like uncharacterized protein
MIRNLFAAVVLLFAGTANAQWDTLNTGTDIRFNAIAHGDMIGQLAVGLNPAMDSGAYGAIFVSGDMGNTWWQIMPAAWDKNIEFWDVDCTSDQRAWIVGDSGHVIRQTIWFITYDCQVRLTGYSLRSGFAVNDSAFYCGGEHGVLFRTFDYGQTWDTLSSGTFETINDIYFSDAENGWIIGDGGFLKMTSDSGNTWTFVGTPLWGFNDFKSFDFQDTLGMNPYLVGESGSAQFSVNGGANWWAISTGTTETINRVRFLTSNAGLMVGNNGFIFRSENGGFTWFSDPSPVSVDLFGIAYSQDTTAFICGDSGVILRSNVDISSVRPRDAYSFNTTAYPNPTNGVLNVQMMLSEESDLVIELLDITGNLINTNYHENVMRGISTINLDLSDYSSGFYFVRVSNGVTSSTLRIIKS